MSSGGNRRKYRIRKGRVAAAVFLLAAVIAVIVFLCVHLTKKGNNREENPSTGVNPSEYISEGEFLRINLLDCNMYVGSVLKLECLTYPRENAEKVIWRSTNPDVVSVNDQGVIIVRGTGIAAITATYGVVTDSVVINGIDKESPEADEYMPIVGVVDDIPQVIETAVHEQATRETYEYTKPVETTTYNVPVGTTANHENTTTEPVTQGATEETITNSPGEQSTTGQHEQVTTEQSTVSPTEQVTESVAEPATEPVTEPMTQPVTEPTTEPATVPPTVEPTNADNSEESVSAAIEKIASAGFVRYLDNTYIFKEDGYYLGEVIVEENYIQIFMMTRTRAFDSAVKNVIKEYLPSGYEGVHARFVAAANDQTFSVDGHRVRIVAGVNGGHSQLFIFF